MTNKLTKDFRAITTKSSDIIHFMKFIMRYIPIGNRIINDGWSVYD